MFQGRAQHQICSWDVGGLLAKRRRLRQVGTHAREVERTHAVLHASRQGQIERSRLCQNTKCTEIARQIIEIRCTDSFMSQVYSVVCHRKSCPVNTRLKSWKFLAKASL